MVSLNGLFFKWMDRFWVNLRSFFYGHKTLQDILFLFLYSIEQLTLLFTVMKCPEHSFLIVGIFIVIFLFTLNFERICMESRYSKYKEFLSTMRLKYNELDGLNKELRLIIQSLLPGKKK